MYYDTYRGKKRAKRGRRRQNTGCGGWLLRALLKLLALALVLVLIAGGVLYALPVALMNVEPAGTDLALTDGLPGNRVNVLLLGLDFLDDGQQRSDTMIVASIGYDCVKLSSIMRDTMVEIPVHGRHKINSAYAIGGPEMAMRVVNDTFDLNITNYIVLDLRTLVDVIDAVGGVEVELSDAELAEVNRFAYDTFRKISAPDPARYARYANTTPLTQTGSVRLNGLFATTYARIRSIDSDYMRTARQREVMGALLTAVRENCFKPGMYIALYELVTTGLETNMSLPELISLGEKALFAGGVETFRTPSAEYMQDTGSSIEITDSIGNSNALHGFIYA